MIRVIEPPAPIVTPEDIKGLHPPTDKAVARLIAAAQATLDGPTGQLGRSLGVQTLEVTLDSWCANHGLPCGPVIEIVSVTYRDEAGNEQTVDKSGNWMLDQDRIWFQRGFHGPALGEGSGVRVRYRAGYDGETTGPVPVQAEQAVILLAQHAKSVGAENLFVASKDVEGVGSTRFVISDQAGAMVKRAVDSLVGGLKVFRL